MFDTLGLICMIWWYMMLLRPLHADIQCMESDAQESPLTNVNMDWRKMELSWESSRNFSEYKCTITDRDMEYIDIKVYSPLCKFSVGVHIPLHKGVLFIIEVPNTSISKQCTFLPGGMNGSAIENFSCVIYNIFLMNCTWQAGRDAPADTQYFLYWQKSREDNQMECELYIKDENCRNMGCIFQNVSIGTEKAYFLVNGSSKDSLIQLYDEYIDLYKIEKLMPPSNITVNCDEIKNDCIIQWQQPQISHSNKDMCFKYEISIKYKDNPKGKLIYTSIQEGGNSNVFLRSNTRKKYVLKMRAAGSACLVSPAWGEWSLPVEFGNEEGISSSVWILLGVAVATPLMATITFFFCKRTGCWKAAFPQIPGPKAAFFTLADANPELMDGKIQSITTENEDIVLVADTVR